MQKDKEIERERETMDAPIMFRAFLMDAPIMFRAFLLYILVVQNKKESWSFRKGRLKLAAFVNQFKSSPETQYSVSVY